MSLPKEAAEYKQLLNRNELEAAADLVGRSLSLIKVKSNSVLHDKALHLAARLGQTSVISTIVDNVEYASSRSER